jgi:HK97 family phage prohead protease
MQREFKNLPYFEIKADGEPGRIRVGVCAVFGNIDSYGDRILPGAFTKTIKEGKARVKHLWNHDFSEPPTAVVLELKEVGRDELPQAVLDFAPEATGGLVVTREYLDTEMGEEVLKGIDAGAITEMSFGFDVISYELVTEGEMTVRNLKELRLYDTSDVLWGMNGATVSTGAKHALPLGVIAQNLVSAVAEVKAGRRNASADQVLIDAIHQAAVDLGCSNCAMHELEAKSQEQNEEQKSEESAQAEAVMPDASLLGLASELNQLELETF